jgi:plastocyanin
MTSIDKAAIGFTIAIVVIGVAFAAFGGMTQNNPPTASAPAAIIPLAPAEELIQPDPFAKLASEVREKAEEIKPEVKEIKPEVKEIKPEITESLGPQTVSVDMPTGTAVPGCEETNACFLPSSITINIGDTVKWTNSDTAAHTVTAGSPADGPSGVFDSSLVLGGTQYVHLFEETGSFDYFCMVHPWMVGNVQVN